MLEKSSKSPKKELEEMNTVGNKKPGGLWR